MAHSDTRGHIVLAPTVKKGAKSSDSDIRFPLRRALLRMLESKDHLQNYKC
jgi:hypothetical protein